MSIVLLGRFGRNLMYGFQRELRPYEAEPFDHVLKASTDSDRYALQKQFEARERIQRWGERVLYFSLPPSHSLPRIAASGKNHCYAAVKLSSSSGNVTAKLMTHLGLLSTLEFSRSPVPVLSNEFEVVNVALHPGGAGYTNLIHDAEHGLNEGT